ncbi:MAG TPA: MFS transporter, partial [Pirellulales bacterium]|nr:MFS transporter [Pirellulales bacterium]
MAVETASHDAAGRPLAAPTAVRYQVMLVAVAASFMLYVDRYCLGELLKHKSVTGELGLDEKQLFWSQSAFFWSYGLMQVPSGWLADRFGPRRLLTIYIVGWSLFAAATGLVTGLESLFLVRLGLGVMQAGAYPTSANVSSRWIPLADRGMASALIAFGGRFGAAAGLVLTTALVQSSGSWRWIMLAYGLLGCLVGAVFWFIARDRPAEHPRVNDAELTIIERGRPREAPPRMSASEHLRESSRGVVQLVRSLSMWAMCVSQFMTNIGWVFLVTALPKYLVEERHFAMQGGANMNALAMVAGMFGTLLGGRLTDVISRSLGLRHGRALPLAVSRFLAAGAYLAIPYVESPWAAVALFCLVSFATDLGLPGTWAYMQDVGGRYVAAVLGWGNMWGNFGAAVAQLLVARLSEGQVV